MMRLSSSSKRDRARPKAKERKKRGERSLVGIFALATTKVETSFTRKGGGEEGVLYRSGFSL